VTFFGERADAVHFSNDGWEAFIGANFVAWDNGSIYGRYSLKDAKYKDVYPGFPVARDETEDRYEIGVGHNFKEGALANWRLSGSWQQTYSRSNVSIFTYDRELVSVNLGRSF